MPYFVRIPETPFAPHLVGMSTRVGWDGQSLTVSWKRGESRQFPAKAGNRVMIQTGLGFPRVTLMTPPRDPVARVAWEKRLFASKRRSSLEQLRADARKETFYSRPHGYDLPACRVYVSPTGHCAVAYRAALEGQIGVPWGWWADAQATPDDLSGLIDDALGVSALQEYTRSDV